METKSFWKSKLFWLGVIEMIGGVCAFITEQPPETSITAMVAGVITVLLRMMTNKGIV